MIRGRIVIPDTRSLGSGMVSSDVCVDASGDVDM
jgi:hypothetical protein